MFSSGTHDAPAPGEGGEACASTVFAHVLVLHDGQFVPFRGAFDAPAARLSLTTTVLADRLFHD